MGLDDSDPDSARLASSPSEIAELFSDYFTLSLMTIPTYRTWLIWTLSTTQTPLGETPVCPPRLFWTLQRGYIVTKPQDRMGYLLGCWKKRPIKSLRRSACSLICHHNAELYQRNGNWLTSYQFPRKGTDHVSITIIQCRPVPRI